MASGYLIDTSSVIKYLNGTFSEPALEFMDDIVDGAGNLSFVSEIELQVWTPESPNDLSIYKQFVANSIIIAGKSNRTSQRLLKHIHLVLAKEPHQPVSVVEFADYMVWEVEEVERVVG